VLQDLVQVVVRSDKEFKLVEEDDSAMLIDLDWRAPYHALTSIFKLSRLYPSLAVSSNMPLEHIVSLFLFPHPWVRLAAARLTSVVLAARCTQDGKALGVFPKAQLPLLVEIARLSTLQLRSASLDVDVSLQVVKNLLLVGRCFATVSPTPKTATEEVAAVEDEAGDSDTGEDDEPDSAEADIAENPLAWLFSRLSFQLRRSHSSRRKTSSISASLGGEKWATEPLAILRWFAAMAAHLDAEMLERFLLHILSPVYRLMQDDTTHDAHMDDLKALCSELQDMIQQKVGTTAFANVYNSIRQRVGAVRRERREKRVVREMRDPEGAAKDRMRRNVMKERNRKRKAGQYAEARGRVGGGKRRRFD